jgi:hypothetical protein
VDSEVTGLLSKGCAFCEEERHATMDCLFVPFHIITGIARHVELQNVACPLMDRSQNQKLGIHVIHNKVRSMELKGQLGPQS